jgi:transposase
VKGTKRHLVVDGNGVPLALHLTAAQVHDSRAALATLKRLRVGRKRRTRGLALDKGYDSRPLRQALRRRGIRASIPERRYRRRRKRGRPPKQHTDLDARRWVVERTFAWLNNGFRRLRVRYERLDSVYRALCVLGCVILCLIRVFR